MTEQITDVVDETLDRRRPSVRHLDDIDLLLRTDVAGGWVDLAATLRVLREQNDARGRMARQLKAEVKRLRAALAESEKRAEAYFDGLERVQARVSGVCNFDARESATPADEGWTREMDELNTFASQTYLSLEAVYSGPKAVTT